MGLAANLERQTWSSRYICRRLTTLSRLTEASEWRCGISE
jgi:hypothetical protein